MLSIVVGFVRMVLDFTFLAPACGSNEVDPRPEIISKVDFLHFATLLALFSTIAMVVISLFTQPRPEKKVYVTLFILFFFNYETNFLMLQIFMVPLCTGRVLLEFTEEKYFS